jgi:hypothetical protein
MSPADQNKVSELFTDDASLDRRVSSELWDAPASAALEEDRIVWSWAVHGPRNDIRFGKQVGPEKGMFERFLDLRTGHDSAILRFAKRFGVLQICEHDLPATHDSNCRPLGFPHTPWEPLSSWRFFSSQAFLLLKIANRLHQGKSGLQADWDAAFSRSKRKLPRWDDTALSLEVQRHHIADSVNEWLQLAGVHPRLWWSDASRPQIKLNTRGLFGALAVQLALATAKADGWATCSFCGIDFNPPKRKAKAGQRNFCPECRAKGMPQRVALADFRRRSREKKNVKTRTK